MHASIGQREHLREKYPLIDLDADFLALPKRAFVVDLLARRCQSRNELRRVVGELFDALERGEIFCQLAINYLGMICEKALARAPAIQLNDVGR